MRHLAWSLSILCSVMICGAVFGQVPDCSQPFVNCKWVDVVACGLCDDGAGGTTGDTCVDDEDCIGVGGTGLCAGRCENDLTIPCFFADPDCLSVGGTCKLSTGGNGTEANPFCRIQDAYTAAKGENGSRNLIWDILVEQGTYQECVTAWGYVADVNGFWDPISTDVPVRLTALEYLRTGVNDESTIIDGTGECDSSVSAPLEPDSTVKIGGTGAELKGFTITGGGKSGVLAQGQVAITNNVIRGNDGELGGGVYLLTASCYYSYPPDDPVDVSAVIADNLIEDNHSKAPPTDSLVDCTICLPASAPCGTGDGGGIFAAVNDRLSCGTDDEVTVSGNIVRNNTVENFNWDPCTAICVSDPDITNCADPGAPECPAGDADCQEQLTYTSSGGGIFVNTFSSAGRAARATITQNVIAGNSILTDALGYYGEGYGGGIYAVSLGYGIDTIEISDNCIGGTAINGCPSDATSGNSSTLDGGGISARARPFVDGRHTMTIDRNTITQNLADRDGGGLDLLIEATEFGSGAANDKVQLNMSRNLVTGNESSRDAGGVKAVADIRRTTLADADALTLAIQGNVIEDNTSGLGAGGALLIPIADADDFSGGICGDNPAPAEARIDFVENLVTDNFAAADNPDVDVIGGGILALPLTFGDAMATVMIDQTTVSGNEVGLYGLVGGIEAQALTYYDCLTGTELGASWMVVDRTIVTGNLCPDSTQCAGIGGPPPGADVLIATVTSSDVYGQDPDYESTLFAADPPAGNITGDPLLDAQFFPDACSPVFDRFCQALDAPASSCVDNSECAATCSATSTTPLATCTLDSQCTNGACFQRCVQAVGCYGNPDTTGDGVVDGQEILGIAASFGAAQNVDNRYDNASDINRNGMNDAVDLSFFTSAFGEVCPAAGGGGGGGWGGGGRGSGGVATFVGDPNNGDPGDVSMEAGASSGFDFDVDVKVMGPLNNLFGVAFRIDVPADIELLPGSSSTGSVLLPGAASTIFDASQIAAGDDVLVVATRVQPQIGFDSGVDLGAGLSHLMTLRFRATDTTAGSMDPTNTEQRQCDVPSETCPPVAVVFTGGDIVAMIQTNQPPTALCVDVTVYAGSECTAGASIDAGSFDPDGDPITVSQDPPGPYGLGQTLVTLTVTDDLGASDSCAATVTVADTTPPELTVTLTPDTLWPPNHRRVGVVASVEAIDVCSTPSVELTSVTSNEADNGVGDGNTINDIQDAEPGTADFDFMLRAERAGGGNGRIYTAIYTATDAAGNAGSAAGFAVVPHDQGGTTDPLAVFLEEIGGGTLVWWSEAPGAQSFDVIRGELSSIVEGNVVISLGPVTCIEPNSTDTSTSGWEDFDLPTPGQAFFYLVEYDDGTSSTYGTESAAKPRAPGPGNCQ